MTPQTIVTVDGVPASTNFYKRLISTTVIDKAGRKADRTELEFKDGPPAYTKWPRKGAIISVQMGDDVNGMRDMGLFTADGVSGKCLPYSMRVTGRSADLRAGILKERKERHWDKTPLETILRQVAGENGLIPSISGAAASHVYDWIGQQDESDMHFLERLKERHNALFDIKAGRLIWAENGAGQSSSGLALTPAVIRREQIVPNTFTYDLPDRGKYKSVVAYYQDRDKAERTEIEVDADADGESVYRIPEPFGSVAEADAAAQAKARDLQRGDLTARCTVIGGLWLQAGAPISFPGVHPELRGRDLVIDEVRHTLTKKAGMRHTVSVITRK